MWLSFSQRRIYLAQCSEHAQKASWIALTTLLIAVLTIIQNVLPLLDVDLSGARIPRISVPWALALFLTGLVVVLVEGGYRRSADVEQRHAAQIRTAQLQSTGPEIVVSLHRGSGQNDDYFIIQHTGGGSIRNIQVGEVNDGNWLGKSELIPYLAVGGSAVVKTKFVPMTAEATRAQGNGGYMLLGAFAMKSLDGTVHLVSVTHEDAASQIRCETDFEIICSSSDYSVAMVQKARRVKPLAALPL